MKKVILLNPLYHPNIGGIENSLFHLAQEFKAKNYAPTIVTSTTHSGNLKDLIEKEKINGVNIYRYKAFPALPRPLGRILSCAFKLKKLKKDYEFEIIVSRHHETTIAAFFAGLKKINYIPSAVFKEQTSSDNNNINIKTKIKVALDNILQVIACRIARNRTCVFSQSMVYGITAITGGYCTPTIIMPGVDTERFYPASKDKKYQLRDELNLPRDKKIFLCLGRITTLKNYDLAVMMAANFNEDEHLVIVGDGPDKNYLQKLSEDLNVESRITFVPITHNPECYYRSADYFLMLSRYESFGQSLLEATASGLPVIALSDKAGVNTATEEIYKNSPNLVFYAHSASPTNILEVARCAECSEPEIFWFERGEFLSTFSWTKICKTLIERN